jgi:hypothetical protein
MKVLGETGITDYRRELDLLSCNIYVKSTRDRAVFICIEYLYSKRY